MSKLKNEMWNLYFGRGGAANHKRNVSKACVSMQDLALKHSDCGQTEKRLFAKKEVYITIVKNGGSFFQIVKSKKKPVDMTADEDEVLNKIMQAFRDIDKLSRTSPRSASTDVRSGKLLSTKRSSKVIPVSRPKRSCRRPSIIEPPLIKYLDKSNVRRNASTSLGEKKVEGIIGESRQKSFGERGIVRVTTDDAFEEMIVEPPKLENSFSALIMTDEITADLPRDSQQSINQNLHTRVQRLENLVAMLMQQKNDEMELLLK